MQPIALKTSPNENVNLRQTALTVIVLFCIKIWKVGYRVPNSAAVTASSRVREIVKNNIHGLVSNHEHCRK